MLLVSGELRWAVSRVANTHADDMDTVWPRHIGSTRSDACRCRCYASSQLLFKSQASRDRRYVHTRRKTARRTNDLRKVAGENWLRKAVGRGLR
ncbi:unnamed protein product [Arctia plantaginis]|uniref:Uncharacterized protein n=1 Tax=Arctia plantaginis TaxID=874455 RepID=A0A8S0YS49_ARCPL|nr:unnamed protein product [Arctia plantaginis]